MFAATKLLACTLIAAIALAAGCEPKGPPSNVTVPPPRIAASEPAQPTYNYEHKIRTGNADMLAQLRAEYVVAVARVGDNKAVDTPFGQEVAPNAQVNVNIQAGNSSNTQGATTPPPLQPEQTPRGFGLRNRQQLVSALMQTNCFTVIERESINDVVRELDFQSSKYVGTPETTGHLAAVRYIIKGGLETNQQALIPQPVTPDNWIGSTGFPESDRNNMPLIFRLRMYNVQTGQIVAVSDGYGTTPDQAVANAVQGLANEVISYHRSRS